MKLKEDIMNLRMAKYEIKNNALLNGNNRYKSNIIKLINRSIADNIIRYLVFSYPSNFKKIDLNSKIYNNIKEVYKDNQSVLQKLNTGYRNEINQIINNMKPTDSENAEDVTTTTENIERNN